MKSKGVLSYIVIFLCLVVGGGIGKYCAKQLVRESGLGSIINSQKISDIRFHPVHLGWVSTTLPFELREDKEIAKKAKEEISVVEENTQAVKKLEIYQGSDKKNEVVAMLSKASFLHKISTDPRKDILGRAVLNSLGAEKMQDAIKNATYRKENGSDKLSYQTVAYVKGTPIIYSVVTCVKDNRLVSFSMLAKENNLNEEIIFKVAKNTVCFPKI